MSIEAMKQALEALELAHPRFGIATEKHKQAITSLRQAIEYFEKQKAVAEIREDMKGGGYIEWLDDTYFVPGTKFYTQPQQDAWKNAAIRLGEELSSFGPDGYYDMTAEQWLSWALDQQPNGKHSLPQPQREFVLLTDDERNTIARHHAYVDNIIKAVEAKLKQKNGGNT